MRECKSSRASSSKPTERSTDWISWSRVRWRDPTKTRSSNGSSKSWRPKPHSYRRRKRRRLRHSRKAPKKTWQYLSNERHYRRLTADFSISKIELLMHKRRSRYCKPKWMKGPQIIDDRVVAIQLKELPKILRARGSLVPRLLMVLWSFRQRETNLSLQLTILKNMLSKKLKMKE